MILNSGAGAGGSSITTRTVTLDEVYFTNYIYDYTTYGYRTFCDSDRTNYYKTFYFPGKVIKVLSYKYMFKTSAGGSFTAEQTFTGNWFISDNTATPELQCTNKYYYRPTELIAVVEDAMIGGSTTTVTITTSEWSSAHGAFNKMVAGGNIISCSLPTNLVPYVGTFQISGGLFSTTASNYYPPSNMVFTVKQGDNLYQGITHKDFIVQLTSSLSNVSWIDVYTGFDPNYVVLSKTGQPSSAQTVGIGVVASSWIRPGLAGRIYNDLYNSSIYNNYNGGDLFRSITVSYTAGTGMTRIYANGGAASTDYFGEGIFHIIAMQ